MNWFAEEMEGEVSKEEIFQKAENGEFHEWNFKPWEAQENGYEDVLDEIKQYTAVKYMEEKDPEKKKAMIDAVLEIYRRKDIFPIQYFSEFGILEEIQKCIKYKAEFDGNTVSCGAGVGTSLCNFLFPNLYDTPSAHDLTKKNARSMFEKFHNDDYLRRAITFCMEYKNGCPVPTSVTGGLRLVGSAPTNFRPMNAKAVYERFCPKGGTIYDFCCVDEETEFFNGYQWKSLAKYEDGDMVLQYNEDGTAELVRPIDYIHYQSESPFYEYEGGELSSCLTGNHDVVYRVGEKMKKIKQDNIAFTNFDGQVPRVFEFNGNVAEEKKKLMLGVVIQAFYSFSCISGEYRVIVLDVPDVEARKFLLENCGAYITEFKMNLMDNKGNEFPCGMVDNRFLLMKIGKDVFREELFKGKTFKFPSEWYRLTRAAKEFLISSIIKLNRVMDLSEKAFLTKDKDNADMIAFLLSSFGDYTSVYQDHFDGDYFVSFAYDTMKRRFGYTGYYDYANYKVVHKSNKYCFVVPSHMLVLRRKDKIFVTGNCGFGGRMLGALSSNNNYRYVGTDPCTETMYHLHQLGEYIEQVTEREDSYELHCCGSEDFKGPANSIDFAFSSPPYFNLEVYSDEPTQCYNKFPELNQWLEGYVRQTIKNIYHMLKPGKVYAVNIADFKVGGDQTVAYVDEWIRISSEEGMPLFDTVYLGVTPRAGSKEQAAGELKKENILIFKKPL